MQNRNNIKRRSDKLITPKVWELKQNGFEEPLELMGKIDQWSQRVLVYLRLFYRTVRLKEDFLQFKKGATGEIGRHDPYVGWNIFDAKVEIPVVFKWNEHDGHITQGVPYELIEFVDEI